jgi:hypothetical protein
VRRLPKVCCILPFVCLFPGLDIRVLAAECCIAMSDRAAFAEFQELVSTFDEQQRETSRLFYPYSRGRSEVPLFWPPVLEDIPQSQMHVLFSPLASLAFMKLTLVFTFLIGSDTPFDVASDEELETPQFDFLVGSDLPKEV